MNADQIQRIERIAKGATRNRSYTEDTEWLIAGWRAEAAEVERLQHIIDCANTPLMRDVLAQRDVLEAENRRLQAKLKEYEDFTAPIRQVYEPGSNTAQQVVLTPPEARAGVLEARIQGYESFFHEGIGEAFHTAFRKAAESKYAMPIHRLIQKLPEKDWANVLDFVGECVKCYLPAPMTPELPSIAAEVAPDHPDSEERQAPEAQGREEKRK